MQNNFRMKAKCMGQALLQVRIDRDLKEQTAAIYDAIGIDLPTAIRMFFKRTVMVGGLPFEGRLIVRDNAAREAFASMRRKVEAAQSEEPTLDEINEYISSVRRSRKPDETAARRQA
ncbi:MAG: type II toxin-antitoxin system RelB/DinJ family antitoxin [Kiritimatiellia bacterium]